MNHDVDDFGVDDDPNWSLEPSEEELTVWVDDDTRMVAVQYEHNDSPSLLSPARARKMATGLVRNASGTDLEDKTNREAGRLRRVAASAEEPTIPIKVPLPRVREAQGNLEPGLYKVTPGEARLIIRGLVQEIARTRLDNEKGTVHQDSILEEATNVLADIEEDLCG